MIINHIYKKGSEELLEPTITETYPGIFQLEWHLRNGDKTYLHIGFDELQANGTEKK